MSNPSLIKQLLQHQGDFMAYLMAMVRDLDAAEEIFQNAAVVVIEYSRPEPIHDFRAWGKEIIRRQALHYLREKGRAASHLSPTEPDLLDQIDRAFDEDTTAADQRQRELEALRECSGNLPEPQRTMVTMRYERRASFAEIGAALGKTAEAIQRALSRSRKALYDCVQSKLARNDGGDMMNNELEGLVVRHLDGHLDVDGQRRLAELLATSAEARQTLARYLRLEGAAIKLASARQLGLPSTDVVSPSHPPEVQARELPQTFTPHQSTSRWLRIAWLAVAASLLAALVLGSRLFQSHEAPQVANLAAVGEMDRLSQMWLQLQENPPIEEPAAVDSAPPDSSLAAAQDKSEAEPDEPRTESDEPVLDAESIAPPSWMVAAMADLAIEKPNQDER